MYKKRKNKLDNDRNWIDVYIKKIKIKQYKYY